MINLIRDINLLLILHSKPQRLNIKAFYLLVHGYIQQTRKLDSKYQQLLNKTAIQARFQVHGTYIGQIEMAP